MPREQIEATEHLRGNPLRVFDDEPIHVDDVEATVGPRARLREATPIVFTGEKFRGGFADGAAARESDTVWGQDFPVDEIIGGLAKEERRGEIRPEQIVAIRNWITGRGEYVDRGRLVESPHRYARRKDRRAGRIEVTAQGWYGQFRIPREVTVVEEVVPADHVVRIREPVAEIIAPAAVLGPASLQLEFTRAGIEAEIPSAEVMDFTRADIAHLAAAVAVPTVIPAIQAPAEAVEEVLRVSLGEAVEQDRPAVRLAVAIGVLGVKDFGHAGDDHAILPARQAGGIGKVVEEDRDLIVDAIATGGFEDFHPTAADFSVVLVEGVVGHLDDPHSATGVPVDVDRVLNEWFGDGEFDGEAGADMDGLEGILRRAGRRRRRPCEFVVGHGLDAFDPHYAVVEGDIWTDRGGEGVAVAGLAFADLVRPSEHPSQVFLFGRIVQIDAVTFGVRKNQVGMAVSIEIDKPQTRVVFLQAFGQGDFRVWACGRRQCGSEQQVKAADEFPGYGHPPVLGHGCLSARVL